MSVTSSDPGRVMRMDSRAILALALFLSLLAPAAGAQEVTSNIPNDSRGPTLTLPPTQTPTPTFQIPDMTKRENFSAAMQMIILLTVLSLAPAILIMMTSFTRIVIVLSLLRQAMGTQQLPPNQILIGLSLFMTFLVMGPTWQKVNSDALQPYMNGQIDQKTALSYENIPMQEVMQKQIEFTRPDDDMLRTHGSTGAFIPNFLLGVRTTALIPGFKRSEEKTSFIMGLK